MRFLAASTNGTNFFFLMVFTPSGLRPTPLRPPKRSAVLIGNQKKADVAEHLGVFDHVGLLVNGPPGDAGLSFA